MQNPHPPARASAAPRTTAPPHPPRLRTGRWRPWVLLGCLGWAFGFNGSEAASVQRLDLNGLCDRADRIVRGVVVDVSPGHVEIGGGQLPTVTYRIKVREMLRGAYASQIEVTMVSSGKESQAVGAARRLPIFQDVPQLERGQEYLLFTTAPSRLGLSTTVGLGQGSFRIRAQDKVDYAVNAWNNAGLGLPSAGPVAYEELVRAIRTRLNR